MNQRQLTPRGTATRDRIIAAASDAIAEHGVDAMSLDRVITAAGASKSQLYHYFSGREQLVHAAVAATAISVLDTQARMMDGLGSWAGIEQWFDCLVALQVDGDARGGCPLASLSGALADRDEPARALLVNAFDSWQASLAAGLAEMRAAGELAPDSDPELLAAATMASVQGGLVLTQVRRDPTQLRIALDGALVFLRAHAG